MSARGPENGPVRTFSVRENPNDPMRWTCEPESNAPCKDKPYDEHSWREWQGTLLTYVKCTVCCHTEFQDFD